mgnify:CR=1 FL=1
MLVPFVQYDDEGEEKTGVYTGMYSFDLVAIKTIEPDEDGDTVIYHRFGSSVTFKIPCEDFLIYVARTHSLDISLLPFVAKHDKGIEKYIISKADKA